MSFGKGAFSHRHKRQLFVRRFRLPKKMDPKKGRNILIIEKGEGFELHEHNFELDGQWQQITCPKKSGLRPRCALCRKGYRPYWVAAFTIIDRDKWKDRNGKWHKDEKKLLMVKDQSMGRLEAILAREKAKDLYGQEIYTCRTGGQQSPAIGDIFDPVKRWSEKQLKREFADQLDEDENFLDSFDYNEVFAALSDEEIEDIAESLPKPEKNGFGDRKKGSSFSKGRGRDDDEDEEPRRTFRGKKGRDDDEEDEDEDEEKPRRKSKASDDEEEDSDEDESKDDEDEDEDEEAPKKGKKSKSSKDEDEDESEESEDEEKDESDDEDEEDEEEKPKKSSKKSKSKSKDEDEGEDEESEDEEKSSKKKGVKNAKIKF